MTSGVATVSLSHLAEAAAALAKLGDVERLNRNAENHERWQLQHTLDLPAADDGAGNTASLVSDDDDLQQRQQPEDINNDNSSNQSKEIFPQRLLAILSEPSLTDVISWLPNGRSFVILRPDVLAEEILPKYLPPAEYGRGGTVKYLSFTRKLNRWGFRQITRGQSTGAFQHSLFRRDEPELCLEMVCQKSRKRSCSKSKERSCPSPSTPVAETSGIGLHRNVSLSPTSSPLPSGTLPPKKRRLFSTDTSDCLLRDTADSFLLSTEPNCKEIVHTVVPPLLQSGTRDEECGAAAATTSETMVQKNIVHPIIKNNADFVASVLRERDEVERLQVAQSMLLKAFLEASAKV